MSTNILNLIKQFNERAIITNLEGQIIYANELFLEAIGINEADITDNYYKNLLQFDLIRNNYFIFDNNKRFYLTEISLNENNNLSLFVFKNNCTCSNQDNLADSSIIFDSIPDIISVHDAENTILYYNKAGYNFSNLKESDAIGLKCYKLIGRDKKCTDCPASESFETGQIIQKIKHFPEENKWLDIRAYPIKNENGKIVQIIEHLRDITEQKEMEKRFQETEIKLGLLMENIPGIVYRCLNDINWTMLFMSEETNRLTGYEMKNFIKNEVLAYDDIIHPEDRPKVRKSVYDGVKYNKNFVVEYRIITKDGIIKHVWEKGKVTQISDIEYIDGVILDITDRKKAETELKISEEKYRLLVENQNELIIKLDKHGRFLYANKAYCEFFGKDENTIIGTNFMPIVHEDDKQETNLEMTRLKNYPHSCYIEHRALSSNGWRWLAWSNKAILNEQNKVIKIIGVGRDITERKIMEYELIKAKEKAERNDNLKSAFLHNVSHKIQKPVNELSSLKLNLDETSDCYKTNLHVTDSIQQLRNYAKNLEEISEIESGRTNVNFEIIDANQLLDEVVQHFKVLQKNPDIEFIVNPRFKDKLIVYSDIIKIKQILLHLLSNAFKYTKSGKVEFTYFADGENIIFNINDTGKGISKEALNHIFNWISVSDMKTRKITKGFGIPISKAYIDLLGGEMSITSVLDKGTKIKVSIPVKESTYKKQKSLGNTNETPNLTSYIILVAEDEKINFQLLKTILTKAGATVLRAQTGHEAVDIVKQNKDISIVLMDIKMPGLSGNEALIEIKKIRSDLKVVACTAFTQSEDSASFAKKNFDGFLPKPIKRKELYNILRELL